MEEKEIIKRCQSGDRAAFDELIRLYYPYVTKYLLKLTCDEALTGIDIPFLYAVHLFLAQGGDLAFQKGAFT